MQQNPWEADSYPVGLETSYILCSMEVHYCADRKMSLNTVQSQIISVQTFMLYFFNFIKESKFHKLIILFICLYDVRILCASNTWNIVYYQGVASAQLFWEVGDRTETVDQIIS